MIPNSYQTPNLYVDRLMPLLSASEFVVLSFMARRVFGFQLRQTRISLRQFVTGTRSRAGVQHDRGTGLSRATVERSLQELKRYRVVTEVEANDPAVNQGTLWSLQLDEEQVDWDGLQARELPRTAPVRVGQTRAHDEQGGRAQIEQGGCAHSDPLPRAHDEHGGVLNPRPPCMETQGETQRERQEEAGAPHLLPPMAIEETALMLRSLELPSALVDRFCADEERAYWAGQWVRWLACIRSRVRSVAQFLERRVSGAVSGVMADREPPSAWWDYIRDQETTRQRVAASITRAAQERVLVRMDDVNSPGLWEFLRVQCPVALSASLGAVERVSFEGGALVLRCGRATGVAMLSKRIGRIVEAVRGVDPAFPDVIVRLVSDVPPLPND